MQFIVEFL